MAEDLTVLIANTGQFAHLANCLKSLFATTTEISLRVIVGFNFPGDSDALGALDTAFPQVEKLRASVKLGYCRAYNQLMARSSGRYMLLLDDDTIIHDEAIDVMVRFMDAHPEVGIASCRTVNPDGSYQKTTALMYDLATEWRNMLRPAAFWNDGIDGTETEWKSVGWLNGNFLMVRAEVVEQVGMLDEYFYTFQCEADWCLRIRQAGWTVAYVPEAEIMHIGGAHSVASKVKSQTNLIRSHINRYYFMRKHYSGAAFTLFRAIMSIGAAFRLARYLIVWLLQSGRRTEARPKIAAYWKITLLGFSVHPERPTAELRHENEQVDKFRALAPMVLMPDKR